MQKICLRSAEKGAKTASASSKTFRGRFALKKKGEFETILTDAPRHKKTTGERFSRKKMKNSKANFLALSGLFAAMYVALTALSALFGLDKGVIQFRLSEVLTVIPFVCIPAIPGIAVGCVISGILFGATPIDIVFGSLTTLLAAALTAVFGKKYRKAAWSAAIPPILLNSFSVPFILKYSYCVGEAYYFILITVFIGETVCAGLIGTAVLYRMPQKILKMLEIGDKK